MNIVFGIDQFFDEESSHTIHKVLNEQEWECSIRNMPNNNKSNKRKCLPFFSKRRVADVNRQPLRRGEKIKTKHSPDDDNPLEMATVRQKREQSV